jgi:multiple antibiotic resistance protein
MSVVDFTLNLAKAAAVLFIIVDPFGNIPIFMGLTQGMTENQKRKIFNTACIVGSILLLVFAFAGQEIFNVFGVSIFSFGIAGGLLLLMVSIKILVSGTNSEEKVDNPETLGAVPIAIPLLVGPGAITTTILNVQTYGVFVAALSIPIVIVITWIILRFIYRIYRFLGKTGSIVIARVMALIIAAIAVEYILGGVMHFLSLTH